MIETLEITQLSPDTRVLIGPSDRITVRASDLERIHRLNVPDPDGKSIPSLEDGHEFPSSREMTTEAEQLPASDQKVTVVLFTPLMHEDGISKTHGGGLGEPSPRTRGAGPVFTKIDGSWRPVRPT